jgi:hypothetical protein
MVTIDFLNPHILVTLFAITMMIIAGIFGDSSKSTAWMFFLGPIALFGLVIYWSIILILTFLN